MAGIKPQNKNGKEKLNVNIATDVLRDVKAYAAFLDGSELGYTVQELLRAQMAKDPKFKEYLSAQKPTSASKLEHAKKGVAA